jgi:CRISPR-associated protein Csb1
LGAARKEKVMADWTTTATHLLASDGPAAIICQQWLMPAAGRDAVIFPPTFAAEGAGKSDYNIDPGDDRTPSIAILDTVGAQANRMEPLFKRTGEQDTPYSKLVPQIEIKAGNRMVHLLDAGHRAADAIVRYSSLGPRLKEAFEDYQVNGDATRLAQLAPTSLVFGAWDSRDTGVKLPRIVESTIRGYDVKPLKRSAQYNPPVDYVGLGLLDDAEEKKVLDAASELGFRHAPAAGTHGGIIVRGEIRREAILSLVALRSIGPAGDKGAALRRYVLGLSLLAMVHEREHNLRQGCLLVVDREKPPIWESVYHNGRRESFVPDSDTALGFAREAAQAFGKGKDEIVEFDRNAANAAIKTQVDPKAKGRRRRGSGDEATKASDASNENAPEA